MLSTDTSKSIQIHFTINTEYQHIKTVFPRIDCKTVTSRGDSMNLSIFYMPTQGIFAVNTRDDANGDDLTPLGQTRFDFMEVKPFQQPGVVAYNVISGFITKYIPVIAEEIGSAKYVAECPSYILDQFAQCMVKQWVDTNLIINPDLTHYVGNRRS